ncbi:MAG: Methyltransferase, FkbM family [Rhodospirillales bacterium]|nr:Methyltransferase, FkbM family [Rhodospirillales bacterium]
MGAAPPRELLLKLSNGSSMLVPASLGSITTYVLIEQEAWFEKELDFLYRWVRPGMIVIDIGANLGVYSLPLTRLVGPAGRVFAYEPGSQPRGLLHKSAALDPEGNLEVIALALSDGEREGRLSIGRSSELGSLGGTGDGEAVRITSLDLEDARRGWAAPDFVKIDAEGEEGRILRGGQGFFARHSPLVMFEIKAGLTVNEELRADLSAMGYGIYRLLAGAPILVPDRPGTPLDAFELNLFAAKPDRARALALEGLLVDQATTWAPDEAARERALSFLQAQSFGNDLASRIQGPPALDPDYRDALAAYAHWRQPAVPIAERYAALMLACRLLEALCTRAPSFARLSTFARAAWDAGLRGQSVGILQQLIGRANRATIAITEPLWPACPRYEAVVPGAETGAWLVAAAIEQFERTSTHSSQFGPASPYLSWLCSTPFASAEMERRRVLTALRDGQRPVIPQRLRAAAADNLNPDIWQARFLGGEAAKRSRRRTR